MLNALAPFARPVVTARKDDWVTFRVNGVEYLTTGEAAARLKVAPQTLRGYLLRGVLPEVPKQRVGTRMQRGFTDHWLAEAEERLSRGAGS